MWQLLCRICPQSHRASHTQSWLGRCKGPGQSRDSGLSRGWHPSSSSGPQHLGTLSNIYLILQISFDWFIKVEHDWPRLTNFLSYSIIWNLPLASPSVAEMLRSRIATKYILLEVVKIECKFAEVQVHFIHLVSQKCVRIQCNKLKNLIQFLYKCNLIQYTTCILKWILPLADIIINESHW